MNEIKINMHLPPGMNAVVQNCVTNKKLYKRIIQEGARITPKECFEDGIIDKLTKPVDLLKETVQLAESLKSPTWVLDFFLTINLSKHQNKFIDQYKKKT